MGTEYRHVPILRIVYAVLVGLLLSAVVFAVWFVYRSVFTKIEEANAIILLRSEVGIETLEFTLFEEVRATEENRLLYAEQETIPDPFLTPVILEAESPSPSQSQTTL